jgi:hypothetical protein
MIWKMLVLDYIQNKRNLLIKFVLPLILFLPAYRFSEGNSILVLILIFTIMTGTGLKIAKLKSNSLYNRLIIAPVTKRRLFCEFAITSSILFFLQFLPVLVFAAFLDKFEILLFSFFSILLIVVVGTIVGIHSRSLGEVHLTSFLSVIPLIAVAMVNLQISYFFPFIYVIHSAYSFEAAGVSLLTTMFFYGILLVDVSRL